MSALVTPLAYVLAFIAVVLLVQALASLLFSAGDQNRRVNRRLAMLDAGMDNEQVYAALVRKPLAGRSGERSNPRLMDRAKMYLHQSGLTITPLRLLAIVCSAATVLWLSSLAVLHSSAGAGAVVNAAMALAGSFALCVSAAWIWVNGRRAARLKKIEEQLPLALDVVNRAIRAGHPVISAVRLASEELGDPIGSEFGLIVDETTYGVEFKEALTNLAHRTGSPDAAFFAVSVGIQSETGGNLGEILNGLATVIRGRTTLSKRVKALASEGRASALILSALPAFLVGFFALVQPHFYSDKFSDPIFWPIVAFVVALYGLGWIMIHRIINFRY